MSSLGSTFAVIQQNIIRSVYSIYLIFGTIGCVLNIILLSRRQFRTVSCCLYFNVGSVAMLISLFFGTIPNLYSLHHPNPVLTNAAFCKVRFYIVHSVTLMYRWLLVAACIDRYAMTSTNNRIRNLASVRVAYRVIVINGIIWLILPIQILVLFDVRNNKCGVVYDINAALYFSCYVLIVGCIFPIAIMIICAMLIRRNLRLKRERHRQLASNVRNEEENWDRKRDQQVIAMLLLQTIIFMVTLAPWSLLYFYNASTIYVTNKSADRAAIEGFITFMAEVIIIFFPAVSFYLYTMVSHKFRLELKKLLSRLLPCKSRHHKNQIHPLTTKRANHAHIELVPVSVHA